MLDGTFEILLGDELIHAGAGDFAFVPRGTVHRFANIGDAPARILAALAPAGIERFFRAVGEPATRRAGADDQPGRHAGLRAGRSREQDAGRRVEGRGLALKYLQLGHAALPLRATPALCSAPSPSSWRQLSMRISRSSSA